MATTAFLENIKKLHESGSGPISIGTSESRRGIDSIAGSSKSIESGLSTRRILNRIQDIQDRNLVGSTQFQFDKVQVPLFNLAENQKKIGESITRNSDAINEQIKIREAQRAETFEFFQADISRLNENVEALGQAQQDAAAARATEEAGGFFDFLPSFDKLKGPLIIAGIAIVGLLGFKALK